MCSMDDAQWTTDKNPPSPRLGPRHQREIELGYKFSKLDEDTQNAANGSFKRSGLFRIEGLISSTN